MAKELPDVVVDVATECYARISRLPEGSEEADAVEHAVSLVLSERRPEKDKLLLLDDVLRNGRHSVRRSRARRASAVEETGQLAARGIATGATRGFVEYETPEQICFANELERSLRKEASRCGDHGARVLDGLLRGETSSVIALGAGVSAATVNRTVRRLRDALIELGYREPV
jgi:hypothetical protein